MDAASHPSISARTLYRPKQRIGLILLGVWSLFIGAVMWAHFSAPTPRVSSAVAVALGVVLLGRSQTAVRIDENRITRRDVGRTRAVGWCSISAVVPAGPTIVPLRRAAMPELCLTNGRFVVLNAIATYSTTDAQANLETVTSARAAHDASCRTCKPADGGCGREHGGLLPPLLRESAPGLLRAQCRRVHGAPPASGERAVEPN